MIKIDFKKMPLKWFRILFAILLGLLINVIFFLAVPLINALFFNQSNASQKDMEVITEVEVLVNEKPKETEQKTIRTIMQPSPLNLTRINVLLAVQVELIFKWIYLLLVERVEMVLR